MIPLSKVREDLLRNGSITDALVLKSSTSVTDIQVPVISEINGEPATSERKLFQAIYVMMCCPPPFEMRSIDLGSRRRILVYEHLACYIAIETEIGHPENKSLRRFMRRLAVRHALDQEPREDLVQPVADATPTAPVAADTTIH